MNQLKAYLINGIFFVFILGTLFHSLYDWSDNNFIVGLFAPVNESIWEHMKLAFFPMLLYAFIIIPKLKSSYPCITSSMLTGVLLCTFLIPVIFYTSTGIIGKQSFILDIGTFILSIMIAFYSVYRLTLSCGAEKYTGLLYALIFAIAICFMVFTYYPPHIGLFAEPSSV